MQAVFEKIIEKLEMQKDYYKTIRKNTYCRRTEMDDCDSCRADHYLEARLSAIDEAIEIVKQEAEKFGRDTNVGSNGWIPCSVSMPVFGKRYLVTGVWKDKEYENYRVYDAVYGSDGIWHGNYYEPVGYEVISWQPLPEPYQPNGE